MLLGWAMFSVKKSRVRQDFELGMVFSKEAKSWAAWHVFGLGNVVSKEIKS